MLFMCICVWCALSTLIRRCTRFAQEMMLLLLFDVIFSFGSSSSVFALKMHHTHTDSRRRTHAYCKRWNESKEKCKNAQNRKNEKKQMECGSIRVCKKDTDEKGESEQEGWGINKFISKVRTTLCYFFALKEAVEMFFRLKCRQERGMSLRSVLCTYVCCFSDISMLWRDEKERKKRRAGCSRQPVQARNIIL